MIRACAALARFRQNSAGVDDVRTYSLLSHSRNCNCRAIRRFVASACSWLGAAHPCFPHRTSELAYPLRCGGLGGRLSVVRTFESRDELRCFDSCLWPWPKRALFGSGLATFIGPMVLLEVALRTDALTPRPVAFSPLQALPRLLGRPFAAELVLKKSFRPHQT